MKFMSHHDFSCFAEYLSQWILGVGRLKQKWMSYCHRGKGEWPGLQGPFHQFLVGLKISWWAQLYLVKRTMRKTFPKLKYAWSLLSKRAHLKIVFQPRGHENAWHRLDATIVLQDQRSVIILKSFHGHSIFSLCAALDFSSITTLWQEKYKKESDENGHNKHPTSSKR